jgi:tetratricopeptide (TPR) repeat protein
VEENVPEPEERRWIEPRLAHLLGLEERTAADKEDLFAAWRLFFERLAERFPVIMVFEDMQWADSSLLDFIEYLLEWSRSSPIFVMTLARPEFTERRPTWGSGKRNFTSLYLEPLSHGATHELLSGLVTGLPHETEQRILERAEGIPLYAVETVRMLLDRGLLVAEGTGYRPTGPIETLEVPETLHALIAARLDGLTGSERRAVQDAAVLGKTFFAVGLASVTDQREVELEPVLASLVRKEILSVQADPRSPERGQYGFLQDLLRTVAYETLSKRERKTKHLAAAAFMERLWVGDVGEIAEVLASHYVQAYRSAPEAEDAAQIRSRARELLSRAGEHAASLAAAEEALRYFEQPLGQAELHELAGRMAWQARQAPTAMEHYEAAIGIFDSIGLTHPSARVSAALAEAIWQEGRIEEAVERMRSAFGVLSGEEEDADLATLAAQLGRLLYFMGRTDEALERIELALSIAEALRLPEVFSQALNTRGLILSTHGRFEEGSLLLRHSLKVAVDNDLSGAALRAYNNVAAQAGQEDAFEDVIEFSREGLELARRVGDRGWELSFLIGDLGELVYLGRWDEAEARVAAQPPSMDMTEAIRMSYLGMIPMYVWRGDLDRARELLALFPDGESAGDVQTRTVFRALQAPLLRAEGRLEEALAAGEEAFAVHAEFGIRAPQVKEGLVEALEAAGAMGDVDKAEELLRRIEAMRPGEISPYLQAQGARFAGRVAALRRDDERVEPGFQAASERFAKLKLPFHLAVAKLEQAGWLLDHSAGERAELLLAEARTTFEDLGARPWLERCDRALARPSGGLDELEPSAAAGDGHGPS